MSKALLPELSLMNALVSYSRWLAKSCCLNVLTHAPSLTHAICACMSEPESSGTVVPPSIMPRHFSADVYSMPEELCSVRCRS